MIFRLVYSTESEHLYEFEPDADLTEFHKRYPHRAGYVVRSISGCEARQYVGQGRPHSTGLVKRSDGTVGRLSY